MVGRKGRQRDAVFLSPWRGHFAATVAGVLKVGLCSNLIVQKEDFSPWRFFFFSCFVSSLPCSWANCCSCACQHLHFVSVRALSLLKNGHCCPWMRQTVTILELFCFSVWRSHYLYLINLKNHVGDEPLPECNARKACKHHCAVCIDTYGQF